MPRVSVLLVSTALLTAGAVPRPIDAVPAAFGGTVSTVALSSELPSSGRLGGVAVDRNGAIYVANFREAVWRVDPDGQVTHLASAFRGSSGNTVLRDGSLLQGSFLDGRVLRVTVDGAVEEYATGLNGPVGMVEGPDGTVYVCNCRGEDIAAIGTDGTVSVFAEGDLFSCPNGIALAANGDLVVTNFNTPTLVRIAPDGSGRAWVAIGDDGNAHLTRSGDDFYVTKITENTVYRVTPDGPVTRIAGSGAVGLDDGPALEASFARPNGIATLPNGDLVLNNLDGEWRGETPTRMVLRRIALD